MEKSEIDKINQEFNDAIVSILGEEARNDQAPLRERLGRIPIGGVIVIADPGDLEPVRYPTLPPEEEALTGQFALEASRRMIEEYGAQTG